MFCEATTFLSVIQYTIELFTSTNSAMIETLTITLKLQRIFRTNNCCFGFIFSRCFDVQFLE